MGRREENKRRKREALEREGLRLFAEQGYEAASIEQIASAAGVARGTFYLYYDDKLALFDVLMDRWFVGLMDVFDGVREQLETAATGAEVLEIYQGMGVGLAVLGFASQQEILVAFRESRQPGDAGQRLRERERAMIDAVTRLTRLAHDRGLIQVRDPGLVSLVVFGAVERLFYEALLGTELGDPNAAAQTVVDLFSSAMGLPAPSSGGDLLP